MNKRQVKGIRYDRGFTLLELMVVIAIISTISVSYFRFWTEGVERAAAQKAAAQFVIYNNAVTQYLFDNYSNLSAQVLGAPAGAGVIPINVAVINTSWLKANVGCVGGGATIAYLPCGFPDNPGFQLQYRTTLTLCPLNAAASLNNWCSSPQPPLAVNQRFVFDATSTIEPINPAGLPAACRPRDLCLAGQTRLDLSSQIISFANTGNSGVGFAGFSNISKFEYTDNTFNPLPAFNVITARVANTQANDPWLRTDGTNYMQANLRMGGLDGAGLYNEFDIVNADNLSASGNLYLDANQDQTGVANPGGGNIYSEGHINVGIVATNTLAAIDIASAVGSVDGDIDGTNNLSIRNDAVFGDPALGTNGDITAMGNAILGTAANGQGDINAFGNVVLGDPATGNNGDLLALGNATIGYYGPGTAAGVEPTAPGDYISGGQTVFREAYLDALEVHVSEGTFWTSIVDNGDIIPKDPITGGAALNCTFPAVAKLYLSPTMYSRDNAGGPIGAVQTWAIDNGATWTAKLRVLTPSGWFEPSGVYGKLEAKVKCGV